MSFLTLKAENNKNVLSIEGPIESWTGVSEYVRWILNDMIEGAPVEIRINSEGGDPVTAFQIYTLLKKHTGKVTCYIESLCASSATIIMCACDVVIANEFSWIMTHSPLVNPGYSTPEDLDQAKNIVESTIARFKKVYADKLKKTVEEVAYLVDKENWMSADQALAIGFVDDIEQFTQVANYKPDRMKLAAQYKSLPNALKPETQNKPQKAMSDFTKKLKAMIGLGETADDIDAAMSIKDLQAKAGQVTALQTKVNDLTAQLKTAQDELEALKADATERQESEAQALATQVASAVDAAVVAGKVKADQSATLKTKYAADLAGLNDMLAMIPDQKPGFSGKKPVQKASGTPSRYNIHPAIAAKLGGAEA